MNGVDVDELAASVSLLHLLREQKKLLEDRIANLQNQIIRCMDGGGDKVLLNGRLITLVRPTRTVVDEFGLRQALTPDEWRAVTKRVYDKSKAELAVEEGVVSFLTINDYLLTQTLAPYIKISGG